MERRGKKGKEWKLGLLHKHLIKTLVFDFYLSFTVESFYYFFFFQSLEEIAGGEKLNVISGYL